MSDDRASRSVIIYTDGACKGNPGPGGWGASLRWDGREHALFDGEALTTNNRMELTAVIEALKFLKSPYRVDLFVDSVYVRDGMQKWIANWKKNGWKTSDRKPVKNADLWRELDTQVQRHQVTWHWVKGHSGDPGNERADELANQGAAPYLA